MGKGKEYAEHTFITCSCCTIAHEYNNTHLQRSLPLTYIEDVWSADTEIAHLRDIVKWGNARIEELEQTVEELYDKIEYLNDKYKAEVVAKGRALLRKDSYIKELLSYQKNLIDENDGLRKQMRSLLLPE